MSHSSAVVAGDGHSKTAWFSRFFHMCECLTLISHPALRRAVPQQHPSVLSLLAPLPSPPCPLSGHPACGLVPITHPHRHSAFLQCCPHTRSPSDSHALEAPVSATHSSAWLAPSILSSVFPIPETLSPSLSSHFQAHRPMRANQEH